MKTTVDLSSLNLVTNEVFYPLYWDESRYLVMMGGAGSGKSAFAAAKVVMRMLSTPTLKMLCVRKVAATLRNSMFDEICACISRWSMEGFFRINRSDMIITCKSGAQTLFKGLDDPEKIKSIQGINSIWIEEATELDEADMDQLNLRLRGSHKTYKQIMVTFNPISVYSFLKRRFFDIPVLRETGMNGRIKKRELRMSVDGKTLVQTITTLITTYRDNRWMDVEDRANIEALIYSNPDMYKIYAEGQWGQIGGLIYEPAPKIIRDCDIPNPSAADDIFYGLDFGFKHPTALIEILLKDNYVFVREPMYAKELTVSDLCARLPLLIRSKDVYGNKRIPIYADSARPEHIEEIGVRTGLNIQKAYKGQNSVYEGIMFVRGRVMDLRVSDLAVNTNREFRTYAWKKDKNRPDNDAYLDEPVKFADDAMDALRYGLHTHLAKNRGGTVIGSMTGKVLSTRRF